MSEIHAPDGPVAKGETVAGIADPEARKLYALSLMWGRMLAETLVENTFGKTAAAGDKDASLKLLDKLKAQAQMARELFWISVREQFDMWDKSSIGMRKDWQVVYSDADENDDLEIFGAGDLSEALRRAIEKMRKR